MFGEMLPKTLFRTYPFRMTIKAIPILSVLYVIFLPFSASLSWVTNLFKKEITPVELSFRTKVREEMLLIAEEGARRGTLFEGADVLIENALNLKERTLDEIMVRIDQCAQKYGCIKTFQRVGEIVSLVGEDEEVLLFDHDCTNPTGYVSILDIAASGKDTQLSSILRELPCFKSSTTLLHCLKNIGGEFPRFSLIVGSEGQIIGVLDKRDLFMAVFGKMSYQYR